MRTERENHARRTKYTAIFTTYALGEVVDTYGGIEKMQEEMKKQRCAIKIGAWLVALVVNQGIKLR